MKPTIKLAICTAMAILLSPAAYGATGTITPSPYQVVLDANGNPVASACVWTYTAGTSTPINTYTDVGLSVANANPIIASSAGRYTAYLTPGSSYKYVIENTPCNSGLHGATLVTADNIAATPVSAAAVDVVGTAGEAITAGNAVYLSDGSGSKVAGSWYKADNANGYSSTLATIGMAPSAITSGAAGSIRLFGAVSGLSSLSVSAKYYVGTSGAITSSPATNGRFIGIADSATSINLTPQPPVPQPWTVISTTVTGTQNDFSPGFIGNTILRCNNATLLTINGFAAGYDGQRVVIVSIGAGEVDLAHQAGGSSAANRFINFATSGLTPLAAGVGTAEYTYDATTARWRLTQHEQGTWIVPATPTFSGNGAQTWTTVTTTLNRYMLRGRTLHIQFDFSGTVGGTPNTLLTFTLANGYTAAANEAGIYNGNLTTAAFLSASASSNLMGFFKDLTAAGNFVAGTWRAIGGFVFEVQ